MTRSNDWDEKERSDEEFDGMQKRDNPEREHEHEFNNGRCFHCNKTREELRREW